jgi:hypothetical protein
VKKTANQILSQYLEFKEKNQCHLPNKLLLITGQDRYNDGTHPRGQTSLSSPPYTMFGDYVGFSEIAFLTHNWFTPDTLIHIMSLFFGSIDETAQFINLLHQNNITFFDFARFLYYEKHIFLVNRDQLASSASSIFFNKITHILDVGSTNVGTTQNIANSNHSIHYGQVVHCSSRQQYNPDRFAAWFLYDNLFIHNPLTANPSTSFNDFLI